MSEVHEKTVFVVIKVHLQESLLDEVKKVMRENTHTKTHTQPNKTRISHTE